MNKLFPPFDLERIKRLAGPNDDFPGRPTYAYGSDSRIDHSWLKAARSYLDQFEPNWKFEFKAGVVYLVGPQGEA